MNKILFDKTSFVPKGSYVYIESVYTDLNKRSYSGFLVERSEQYIIITKNNRLLKHLIDECYYDYYYKICETKKTKVIKQIRESFSPRIKENNQNELTTENVLFESENIINKYNGKY